MQYRFGANAALLILAITTMRVNDVSAATDSYTITWTGVAGLCLDDGQTTILIDPHICRVSFKDWLLGRDVVSDRVQVQNWLKQRAIRNVSAVIATETHFDHALDVTNVASLTGAKLVGSSSTANVALGGGLPSDQIDVVTFGDKRQYGDFAVEFMESHHTPLFFNRILDTGFIDEPLEQPAAAREYLMGGHFALLFQHPAGSIVTHATPVDDLRYRDWTDLDIQAVFMSVTFRRNTSRFLERVVSPLQPEILYPIHCDNFFRDLPETPGEYKSFLKASVERLGRWVARRELPYQVQMLTPYSPIRITRGTGP